MSKNKNNREEDHNNSDTAAIGIRGVDKQTWKDFRKLAALHEMTLPDYLQYIVSKEMSRVQISK